jgi:hypothetical protein
MRPIFAAGLAAAALLAALPASAAVVHFTAKLNGAAETPPNDSKATGAAKVSLDTATRKLSWSVSYAGLSGPPTAAHFHGPAPAGKAAPVVVPLTPPLASPIKGSATLTESQIGDLRGGLWYINIHTAKIPDGEIRGQVVASH